MARTTAAERWRARLARPQGLGLLEYAARLALAPLVGLAAWTAWRRGWPASGSAWAVAIADLMLALRWRALFPKLGRSADPGPGLAPLSKLAMIGALVLVPLFVHAGEWLAGAGLAVMAAASAGLWLRWRWSLWAWVAYAVAAMGDWLIDAVKLIAAAARAPEAFPMLRVKPLLAALPSALFALAVLTWVIEWHARTFAGERES